MSIELVMPSNYLILCCPHLLLPSIFPSIRVFSSELALYIRWPKSWSFCFSISPSNEYSGLSSFRIDWFDILAVQETLKNLRQHPQFKCINSLALRIFYCPALTSIHDHWKNHSFDYTDIFRQRNVSASLICCLGFSLLFYIRMIDRYGYRDSGIDRYRGTCVCMLSHFSHVWLFTTL